MKPFFYYSCKLFNPINAKFFGKKPSDLLICKIGAETSVEADKIFKDMGHNPFKDTVLTLSEISD